MGGKIVVDGSGQSICFWTNVIQKGNDKK